MYLWIFLDKKHTFWKLYIDPLTANAKGTQNNHIFGEKILEIYNGVPCSVLRRLWKFLVSKLPTPKLRSS